ncbi:hypothetical protein LCGC14_0475760 [marine sediment metagenome]|uniref:Uncharacterized protein n=1 Tax=marine sediment metagenome TaxID=412755 RepID=A0A0F9SG05_9ZZZZ
MNDDNHKVEELAKAVFSGDKGLVDAIRELPEKSEQSENKRLKAELAEANRANDTSRNLLSLSQGNYEQLQAELAKAKEALRKYGKHGMSCPDWLAKRGWKGFKCECGLEQALKGK